MALYSRFDAFTVTVSKAGYKPSTTQVKTVMSAGGGTGFLGNALVGGVIGAAVDVSSGAMNDLKPNPLKVTLEALPAIPVETPPPAPVAAAVSTTSAVATAPVSTPDAAIVPTVAVVPAPAGIPAKK